MRQRMAASVQNGKRRGSAARTANNQAIMTAPRAAKPETAAERTARNVARVTRKPGGERDPKQPAMNGRVASNSKAIIPSSLALADPAEVTNDPIEAERYLNSI